jgi:mannosylglycoprotein endo-beta-mannosidase
LYRAAPDIHAAAAGFYTLVWRAEIPAPATPGAVQRVQLRGVNYGVSVFVNGAAVPEASSGATFVEGMFRRSEYELPAARHGGVNVIAIQVSPPPFLGNRTSAQGGAHELAKSTTAQFSAGWDWIASTPDRNTGLWDKVTLVETPGPLAMRDPFMSVRSVTLRQDAAPGAEMGASAVVDPKVTLKKLRVGAATGKHTGAEAVATVSVTISLKTSAPKSIIVGRSTARVSLGQATEIDVSLPAITITEPLLWYPHTHGTPNLYVATFSVSTSDDDDTTTTTTTTTTMLVRFGIRKIEPYLHPKTRGQTFRINGVPIFLQGGNWIHTDQFLRYASDAQRYSDEVELHRAMGMNLIRVWGGGLAERPEFYAAADEQGVLVMQEFWMTGDNNGRWAGNYSFPTDHSTYLACVRDTVRMLRNHPSLLFWCGGNELFPAKKNPPPDIARAIPEILQELDQPGRFYIASSMSNYTDFDPAYALAPKDGPYGILLPSDFYERNPGLTFWNGTRAGNLIIGFQPELGSVSTPTYESLQRFISDDALESHFPGAGGNKTIHHVWNFHKHIGYTTPNVTWRQPAHRKLSKPFDHVSNFFGGNPPSSARDYAAAAIAQMLQFQALFEGFQTFMWEYYSAVIMWKSQSPWPVLRGAFYDSWLKQTGGYWGVQRALRTTPPAAVEATAAASGRRAGGLHVQLNLKTWHPTVLSKGPSDFVGATMLEVRTSLFSTKTGHLLASVSQPLPSASATGVKAHSVVVLRDAVSFPALPTGETTALVRMRLVDVNADGTADTLAENEYLQSDPNVSPQNYADVGKLRTAKKAWVDVRIAKIHSAGIDGTWDVTLEMDAGQPHPGLFVELDIVTNATATSEDTRVLPIFWSDNLVTLLPGEQRLVTAQSTRLLRESVSATPLYIRARGWNVVETTALLRTSSTTQSSLSRSTKRTTAPASRSWYDIYREGMATPTRGHSLDLVRDFHAVGDGTTPNTNALRAAIAAAAAWNRRNDNRGVEIVVPALSSSSKNVYLSAPVNLTSHLTLTVAGGAVLKASDDPRLWPIVPPLMNYGQGRDHPGPRRCPFLGGLHLEDVVLRGPGGGRIDGSGASWWARHKSGNETYTRGRLVEFLYSDGILLEELELVNSPFWTIHPTFCSNVVARRLVILNPNDAPNTDGFDPDSTVNVSLTDSYFDVGDDGVAIKSGWDCFGIDAHRPTENVHIRNLTVNSPCCAGVCIGSEMSGGVANVFLEDIHLQHVGQGLYIKAGMGRGGFVRNITYRNVDMENTIHSAIEINDFYGSINPACHGRDAGAVPAVDGVVFHDIRAHGKGGIAFEGLPQKAIMGIAMHNVTVVKEGGGPVWKCANVEGGSATDVVPPPPSWCGFGGTVREDTVNTV